MDEASARASARIIVGVDGSPSSVDALRYAARIGTALGHPIHVVTTLDAPLYGEAATVAGWAPEQWAETVLDGAVEDAFGDNVPHGMTRAVRVGPPARTLIELSEHAAMLVLGSRGHGGFSGLLLGSVSAACAEHAHCPVLVVHGPSGDPTSQGEAS
jgi:nucleotide-binding universal stress UspA family protein